VTHASPDLDEQTRTLRRIRRRLPGKMTVLVGLLLLLPPAAFFLGGLGSRDRGSAVAPHRTQAVASTPTPTPTPTPVPSALASATATAAAVAAATAVVTIIVRPVPGPTVTRPAPAPSPSVKPVHTSAPPASHPAPPSPSVRKCVLNLLGVCV